MLQKLRIKLTLICVIMTGVLLSLIAVSLLWISGNQMRSQQEIIFQNNINSIIYRLQSNSVIDDLWLAQLENGNRLIIHIEDNKTPIYFHGSWQPKTPREQLIAMAQQKALQQYSLDVKEKPFSVIDINSVVFEIQGKDNDRYQAAVVLIPSATNWHSLTLLRDITPDMHQQMQLRILSASIILGALLLLFAFSWWFSGKAIKPLEISRKKQVEFIAAASHELRSPLAVIRGSLSAISLAQTNQDKEKFYGAADRECERMSRLIDDLLLLASTDAKTWLVQSEPIQVDTLLTQLYESFEPIAQAKQQQLSLQLPDYVIPIIQGDSQRLFQALSIILDNACCYTQEKGQINLSLTLEKNYLQITVADNGPGIADQFKDKIFERFYRLTAARSEKNHYGLGLSIAQEITALHKGKLEVKDTPGGGSTFIIKLEL